jgi:hypothetical protein
MDTGDDESEIYEFGWWPEVAGAAGVALLIWFLITFARGSL